MKLAIMQPYFFPYIGYFQLIYSVDKFIFLDDVNYIKQGWIHRNKIQSNNKHIFFGIQTSKSSQNKKINEITINPDNKWKNKLLNKLHHSYVKAPNYSQIQPIIKSVITLDTNKLSDICKNSVIKICNYLEIKTEILNSSSELDLKISTGQERIIKICKNLNANHYINTIGGQSLYNINIFSQNNITLNFIKTNNINYKNSTLSIIDLLMHCNKKTIISYLNSYSLI